MRVGLVQSTEFLDGDRRLNGSFYLSEDESAMRQLRRWKGATTTLRDLAIPNGIFSGGIFRMIEARDSAHGLPYVSAKDLVMSDIRPTCFISYSHGQLLDSLKLEEGMILVTCSGMNLGKSIWVRGEMNGLCASGDLIRVLANESTVAPGYIQAFLSSRFGWVSLRQLIFGGSIKHIEPRAVSQIQVPRIGSRLESQAHKLIADAGSDRTRASEILSECRAVLLQEYGTVPLASDGGPASFSIVSSRDLEKTRRLEGYFYNSQAKCLDDWAFSHSNGFWKLGDLAQVYDVPPFKHIYVNGNKGVPFYTSSDLFSLDRKSRLHLSRTQTRGLQKYILEEGCILLARSGQLGGIIGRPQFADKLLHGSATSDHVIRIVPNKIHNVPAGFLFVYLSLPTIGYPLIARTIAGKSVPALWPCYLSEVRIVKVRSQVQFELHEKVMESFALRASATLKDDRAREIVERALGENG